MGNEPGKPTGPGGSKFSTRFTLRGLSWRAPRKDLPPLPGVDEPVQQGDKWDSETNGGNWDNQSEASRPQSWAPWNEDGTSVRDSGNYDQGTYDKSTMRTNDRGYDQGTYDQSTYRSGAGDSQYDQSTYRSGAGDSQYDQSTYRSGAGDSQYDQSTYRSGAGDSQYDQSTFGSQSGYDQSTYGSQSQYDQSTYGSQSQYDQSTFGSGYDQSTYGSQASYMSEDPYSKGPEFSDLYDKLVAYYMKHDPDAVNNKEIDLSGMTSWCLESEEGSLEELNDKLYDRFGESLEEFENGGPINGRPYSTMGRSERPDSRPLSSFTLSRTMASGSSYGQSTMASGSSYGQSTMASGSSYGGSTLASGSSYGGSTLASGSQYNQSTMGSLASSVRSMGSRLSSMRSSLNRSSVGSGFSTNDSEWDAESGYDASTMGTQQTTTSEDVKDELERFFLQYEPEALNDIEEYLEEYEDHGRMALNVKLFRNFGKNLTSLEGVQPESMGTMRKTSKLGVSTVDRSVLNEMQSTRGQSTIASVKNKFPDFTRRREKKIAEMGANNNSNVGDSLQRKWNHLNKVSRGQSVRISTKLPDAAPANAPPPPGSKDPSSKFALTPFNGVQSSVDSKGSSTNIPPPRGMRGSVKDITVFANKAPMNNKTGQEAKSHNSSTMKSSRSKVPGDTMKSSRTHRTKGGSDTLKSSRTHRSSRGGDTMKSTRSRRTKDDTMKSSRTHRSSRGGDDTLKSRRSKRGSDSDTMRSSRRGNDTLKSKSATKARGVSSATKMRTKARGTIKRDGSACSKFQINLEGEFGTCINCGLRKDDHTGGTAPRLAPTLARKFDKINSTA